MMIMICHHSDGREIINMLKVILKNKEMQKLMTIFDLELYKVFNAF